MPENDSKRKWMAEITASLLFEIGRWLIGVAIAAAVSVIGAGLLSNSVTFLQEYKWPLFVIFFAVLIILIYYLYDRIRANRPNFPRLETDFCIVERYICYEYLSQSKMIYKRRYILKALRNGLNAYHDQFRWTGEGSVDIRSAIPEHEIHLTGKKNVWQLFEIRFPKSLRKDEQIEAEVVWSLEDPHRKAVPFFSVTIHEPTEKLVLELKLPVNFGVKEVVCEHSPDIGAKLPFESEIRTMDRNGRVVWETPKPGLLHYYEIRWVNHQQVQL